MLLRCLVTASTMLLCSATSAAAATAGRSQFDAAPGEANVVSVSIVGNEIVWSDHGAPLMATGSSCSNTSANEVRCRASRSIEIELGDLDDSFVASQDFDDLVADGGDGNDALEGTVGDNILSGGGGDDELHGGASADHIIGGGGRDTLFGEGGNDTLQDDDAGSGDRSGGADFLNGGPGADTADYIDRPRSEPIRIDLAGNKADGDSLSGIENATGGSGDDVIVGTSGPNEIFGGPVRGGGGADTIRTGGGRDTIFAEAGSRINAGAGNDDVTIDRGRRSRGANVTCGRGRDIVESRPADRLQRDCEIADLLTSRLNQGYLSLELPGRLTATGLAFDALCAGTPPGVRKQTGPRVSCTGTLELRRTNGRSLGSARYSIRGPGRGTKADIVVLLDPQELALVRAGLQVRVSTDGVGFTMLHR